MYKILANTIFLGKDILHLTDCHSTNDELVLRLKRNEIAEGSIVIADHQSRGRGQRGNMWLSEAGRNLTFSILLRPVFLSPSEQFWLNILVCNAIWETLSAYLPGIQIKWPNDLVHESEGKLGGVLIENTIQNATIEHAVIGIGLNINQLNFPFSGVCSMASLAGQEFDKWQIFKILVKNLEGNYLLLKRGQGNLIKTSYLANLYRLQKWAVFDDGIVFEGRILGIEDEGRLRIERRDGKIGSYAFKEVRFL